MDEKSLVQKALKLMEKPFYMDKSKDQNIQDKEDPQEEEPTPIITPAKSKLPEKQNNSKSFKSPFAQNDVTLDDDEFLQQISKDWAKRHNIPQFMRSPQVAANQQNQTQDPKTKSKTENENSIVKTKEDSKQPEKQPEEYPKNTVSKQNGEDPNSSHRTPKTIKKERRSSARRSRKSPKQSRPYQKRKQRESYAEQHLKTKNPQRSPKSSYPLLSKRHQETMEKYNRVRSEHQHFTEQLERLNGKHKAERSQLKNLKEHQKQDLQRHEKKRVKLEEDHAKLSDDLINARAKLEFEKQRYDDFMNMLQERRKTLEKQLKDTLKEEALDGDMKEKIIGEHRIHMKQLFQQNDMLNAQLKQVIEELDYNENIIQNLSIKHEEIENFARAEGLLENEEYAELFKALEGYVDNELLLDSLRNTKAYEYVQQEQHLTMTLQELDDRKETLESDLQVTQQQIEKLRESLKDNEQNVDTVREKAQKRIIDSVRKDQLEQYVNIRIQQLEQFQEYIQQLKHCDEVLNEREILRIRLANMERQIITTEQRRLEERAEHESIDLCDHRDKLLVEYEQASMEYFDQSKIRVNGTIPCKKNELNAFVKLIRLIPKTYDQFMVKQSKGNIPLENTEISSTERLLIETQADLLVQKRKSLIAAFRNLDNQTFATSIKRQIIERWQQVHEMRCKEYENRMNMERAMRKSYLDNLNEQLEKEVANLESIQKSLEDKFGDIESEDKSRLKLARIGKSISHIEQQIRELTDVDRAALENQIESVNKQRNETQDQLNALESPEIIPEDVDDIRYLMDEEQECLAQIEEIGAPLQHTDVLTEYVRIKSHIMKINATHKQLTQNKNLIEEDLTRLSKEIEEQQNNPPVNFSEGNSAEPHHRRQQIEHMLEDIAQQEDASRSNFERYEAPSQHSINQTENRMNHIKRKLDHCREDGATMKQRHESALEKQREVIKSIRTKRQHTHHRLELKQKALENIRKVMPIQADVEDYSPQKSYMDTSVEDETRHDMRHSLQQPYEQQQDVKEGSPSTPIKAASNEEGMVQLFGPQSRPLTMDKAQSLIDLVDQMRKGVTVSKNTVHSNNNFVPRVIQLSTELTRLTIRQENKKVTESFVKLEHIQSIKPKLERTLRLSLKDSRGALVLRFTDCEQRDAWNEGLSILLKEKSNIFYLLYFIREHRVAI